MAVEFIWDNVVIGTTLSAVTWAEKMKCPILFNKDPSFFKFHKLQCGSYEYEKWQEVASNLAIQGLNPFGDKIGLIRIHENKIDLICHNRKYIIYCNNIRFFDDENIENFPFEKINIESYRVCDWFRVTSGANHKYDILEGEEDFVKKIYFVPKINLPKYKDCVVESIIHPQHIEHHDYTSTMVRLKTIEIMNKNGIIGTRHTKNYCYPIKMTLNERQYFKIKESVFKQNASYTLDTRGV